MLNDNLYSIPKKTIQNTHERIFVVELPLNLTYISEKLPYKVIIVKFLYRQI